MAELFNYEELPMCCGATVFNAFVSKKDYQDGVTYYNDWEWEPTIRGYKKKEKEKPTVPYIEQLTKELKIKLKEDKLPCFIFAITTLKQEKDGVGEALKAAGFELTSEGMNRIHNTRLHFYMLKRNPVRKRKK